jgi:glucose/arabinose dehydrogenase
VSANFLFQQVASGLTQPVLVTHAGDGSGRLFVVEQPGRIRIVKNGSLLATPFLDIAADLRAGGERGLLSLAFHPSYETNGYFYVMYTAPRPGDSVGSILTLKRFSASGAPDAANYASGQVLLTIDHPSQSNHNGGTLAFGPDGYLYWSTGDGGGSGDPYENAQDLTKRLGKILRLDVDAATPYAIPAGNPFVESPVDDPATLPEIWAYGLRNPWRMAFDRGTGDLYIGDVGQGSWEEIDFQPAASTGGENYGWDMYEADAEYNPPNEGPYDPAGKTFPVAKYSHSLGCSVTGGHVYRASNFPSLQGYYFFGDYCSGRIWAMHYDDSSAAWITEQVADTAYNISSFGEDEAGQVYFTALGQGRVLKLSYKDPAGFARVRPFPAEGAPACTTPDIGADLLLSDFTRTPGGVFDPATAHLELDGVDVTGQARVRVTQSLPNSRASLSYTPTTPLALDQHLAMFTYEGPDGPLTALWQFTATSDPCTPITTLLGAATTATPAASTTQVRSPLSVPASTALPPSRLAAPTQPIPFSNQAPLISGGPLGCLPWGLICPRTIIMKY